MSGLLKENVRKSKIVVPVRKGDNGLLWMDIANAEDTLGMCMQRVQEVQTRIAYWDKKNPVAGYAECRLIPEKMFSA
jgi:hypothetical protein